MPVDQETISRRLDELIQSAKSRNTGGIEEAMSGAINILERLYSTRSEKTKAYVQLYRDYASNVMRGSAAAPEKMRSATLGVLNSIKSEVEAGLIANLELQSQGGIFGDFVALAKESLNENKDVAAVLVSAALEDTLKRFALQNGLDIDDTDMSQVINAMKSKGLLQGPQASVVQS